MENCLIGIESLVNLIFLKYRSGFILVQNGIPFSGFSFVILHRFISFGQIRKAEALYIVINNQNITFTKITKAYYFYNGHPVTSW